MLPENISSPGGKEESERNSWWYKIFCLERFWNCSLATVGKSLWISHLGYVLTSAINAANKIQSFVKKKIVNHFSVSSSRWQLDLPWNRVRAEPRTVGSAFACDVLLHQCQGAGPTWAAQLSLQRPAWRTSLGQLESTAARNGRDQGHSGA